MDALILSCSTGGGHNAAGEAIKEELSARGHHVKMMDPYALISSKLASAIGNVYIKLVQKSPALFGVVYLLGELYRKLPFRSPIYFVNQKPARVLQRYLQKHHVDVILMPHLFPAEMITYLRNKKVQLPLCVFVATDYACIPFTEETECDYYIIPHKELTDDFTKKGIPEEKIKPLGIPVKKMFSLQISKEEAKEKLGLDKNKKYYLIAGGSIGAGNLEKTVKIMHEIIHKQKINGEIIVICGNNDKIYHRLMDKYGNDAVILKKTNQMALYMKASEMFLSKSGGLSSTESAVAGVLLVNSGPIPGCETKNKRFFQRRGLCVSVKKINKSSMEKVLNNTGKKVPSHIIPGDAREKICDWLETQF